MVANPDGTIDLLPTAEAAKAAAERKAAEEAEAGRPLSPAQKELAVQCFALKLLSGGCDVCRSPTKGRGHAGSSAGQLRLLCPLHMCSHQPTHHLHAHAPALRGLITHPSPLRRLLQPRPPCAARPPADFTLMYQHCVGVLLKRDTDLSAKEVGKGWGVLHTGVGGPRVGAA